MQLFHRKIGDGPAIVVLHGLFGMSDNWMSIAKSMSSEYCFYLLDLRNHGRSPHVHKMNYFLMAADVKQFILENNLDRPALLGHSMGGKVAMQFASNYPDLTEKLIVVDITPAGNKSAQFARFLDAMLGINVSEITSRKQADYFLEQELKVNKSIILFLLKNLYRDEHNQFRWHFNLPALKENMPNLLDAIEVKSPIKIKTIFIKGQLSDYITETDYPFLKNKFPNSEIVTIPKANHWVHSTAPVFFQNTLRNFLARPF